jgi:DNA-binding MarR family transcriptional regulator
VDRCFIATMRESDLDHLRRTNLGRLLDEAHLAFDAEALRLLRERGYPWLTSAHTHVMRTMAFEGASVVEMAARAAITKQAMAKLVQDFTRRGFLKISPNLEDRRSATITVTDQGRQLLSNGVEALQQAEGALTVRIGGEELERLRQILLSLRNSADADELAVARRRRRAGRS